MVIENINQKVVRNGFVYWLSPKTPRVGIFPIKSYFHCGVASDGILAGSLSSTIQTIQGKWSLFYSTVHVNLPINLIPDIVRRGTRSQRPRRR